MRQDASTSQSREFGREMEQSLIERYRANLQDEIDSTTLYTALAEIEESPELREVFARLATIERQHADFWQQKLLEAGVSLPTPRAGWRTRLLI